MRHVTITLVRAWNPCDAAEEGARIVFAMVLDPLGRPDAAAWGAGAAWAAARSLPGMPEEPGEVVHDGRTWLLRFPADPDAPALRLGRLDAGLRPGDMLTIADQAGAESAWRVVGIG